jgi:hypothetical protein
MHWKEALSLDWLLPREPILLRRTALLALVYSPDCEARRDRPQKAEQLFKKRPGATIFGVLHALQIFHTRNQISTKQQIGPKNRLSSVILIADLANHERRRPRIEDPRVSGRPLSSPQDEAH